MFSAHLSKKLFRINHLVADSSALLIFNPQNKILRSPNLFRSCINQIFASSSSLLSVDLSDDKLDERKSYTVSYLINSCGLSPEKAAYVSSKLILKDSHNPDSVLAQLQNHGLSKTQIAIVVRKTPNILLTKEKSLLPKLQFFQSIGISKALLAKFITTEPSWLNRSLENFIIPNFKLLKSILLTDEQVVITCCKLQWFSVQDMGKNLAPNMKFLKELKLPESSIRYLLASYPRPLSLKTDELRKSVSQVLEMGFNPFKSTFVLALNAVSGNNNKTNWTRCYETYSNWGWSKEDIHIAFRKHPNCMLLSENKISRTMDFLVNKNWVNSRTIADYPGLLFYNLENRIIPRYSVYLVLLSRGLICKKLKLSTVLVPVEKNFLKKFVVPYENEVPKLYDFYKGKVGVEELFVISSC